MAVEPLDASGRARALSLDDAFGFKPLLPASATYRNRSGPDIVSKEMKKPLPIVGARLGALTVNVKGEHYRDLSPA
jgi:hypothetical protein